MSTEARIASLEQSQRRIQATLDRLPLYLPPSLSPQVIKIIGGNTVSGVDCIQYSATAPVPTKVYDPDVDAVFTAGLGRGWLMSPAGQQLRRVLTWNDLDDLAMPIIGNYRGIVRGTTTISYSGTAMLIFLLTYPA